MSDLFTSGPGIVVTKVLRTTPPAEVVDRGASRATCYLSAMEVPHQNDHVDVRLAARNLGMPAEEAQKVEPRAFLRISRIGRGKKCTPVFSTEVSPVTVLPALWELIWRYLLRLLFFLHHQLHDVWQRAWCRSGRRAAPHGMALSCP